MREGRVRQRRQSCPMRMLMLLVCKIRALLRSRFELSSDCHFNV